MILLAVACLAIALGSFTAWRVMRQPGGHIARRVARFYRKIKSTASFKLDEAIALADNSEVDDRQRKPDPPSDASDSLASASNSATFSQQREEFDNSNRQERDRVNYAWNRNPELQRLMLRLFDSANPQGGESEHGEGSEHTGDGQSGHGRPGERQQLTERAIEALKMLFNTTQGGPEVSSSGNRQLESGSQFNVNEGHVSGNQVTGILRGDATGSFHDSNIQLTGSCRADVSGNSFVVCSGNAELTAGEGVVAIGRDNSLIRNEGGTVAGSGRAIIDQRSGTANLEDQAIAYVHGGDSVVNAAGDSMVVARGNCRVLASEGATVFVGDPNVQVTLNGPNARVIYLNEGARAGATVTGNQADLSTQVFDWNSEQARPYVQQLGNRERRSREEVPASDEPAPGFSGAAGPAITLVANTGGETPTSPTVTTSGSDGQSATPGAATIADAPPATAVVGPSLDNSAQQTPTTQTPRIVHKPGDRSNLTGLASLNPQENQDVVSDIPSPTFDAQPPALDTVAESSPQPQRRTLGPQQRGELEGLTASRATPRDQRIFRDVPPPGATRAVPAPNQSSREQAREAVRHVLESGTPSQTGARLNQLADLARTNPEAANFLKQMGFDVSNPQQLSQLRALVSNATESAEGAGALNAAQRRLGGILQSDYRQEASGAASDFTRATKPADAHAAVTRLINMAPTNPEAARYLRGLGIDPNNAEQVTGLRNLARDARSSIFAADELGFAQNRLRPLVEQDSRQQQIDQHTARLHPDVIRRNQDGTLQGRWEQLPTGTWRYDNGAGQMEFHYQNGTREVRNFNDYSRERYDASGRSIGKDYWDGYGWRQAASVGGTNAVTTVTFAHQSGRPDSITRNQHTNSLTVTFSDRTSYHADWKNNRQTFKNAQGDPVYDLWNDGAGHWRRGVLSADRRTINFATQGVSQQDLERMQRGELPFQVRYGRQVEQPPDQQQAQRPPRPGDTQQRPRQGAPRGSGRRPEGAAPPESPGASPPPAGSDQQQPPATTADRPPALRAAPGAGGMDVTAVYANGAEITTGANGEVNHVKAPNGREIRRVQGTDGNDRFVLIENGREQQLEGRVQIARSGDVTVTRQDGTSTKYESNGRQIEAQTIQQQVNGRQVQSTIYTAIIEASGNRWNAQHVGGDNYIWTLQRSPNNTGPRIRQQGKVNLNADGSISITGNNNATDQHTQPDSTPSAQQPRSEQTQLVAADRREPQVPLAPRTTTDVPTTSDQRAPASDRTAPPTRDRQPNQPWMPPGYGGPFTIRVGADQSISVYRPTNGNAEGTLLSVQNRDGSYVHNDVNGRLQQTQDSAGNIRRFTWGNDAQNRPRIAEARDGNNNLVDQLDAQGQLRRVENGRLGAASFYLADGSYGLIGQRYTTIDKRTHQQAIIRTCLDGSRIVTEQGRDAQNRPTESLVEARIVNGDGSVSVRDGNRLERQRNFEVRSEDGRTVEGSYHIQRDSQGRPLQTRDIEGNIRNFNWTDRRAAGSNLPDYHVQGDSGNRTKPLCVVTDGNGRPTDALIADPAHPNDLSRATWRAVRSLGANNTLESGGRTEFLSNGVYRRDMTAAELGQPVSGYRLAFLDGRQIDVSNTNHILAQRNTFEERRLRAEYRRQSDESLSQSLSRLDDSSRTPAQRVDDIASVYLNRCATRENRADAINRLEQLNRQLTPDSREARLAATLLALSRADNVIGNADALRSPSNFEQNRTRTPEERARIAQDTAAAIQAMARTAFQDNNAVAAAMLQHLGISRKQEADRFCGNLTGANATDGTREQAIGRINSLFRQHVNGIANELRADRAIATLGERPGVDQLNPVERTLRGEAAEGNLIARDRLHAVGTERVLRQIEAISSTSPEAARDLETHLQSLIRASVNGNRYAHHALNMILIGGSANHAAAAELRRLQGGERLPHNIAAPNLSNLSAEDLTRARVTAALALRHEAERGNPPGNLSVADAHAQTTVLEEARRTNSAVLLHATAGALEAGLNGTPGSRVVVAEHWQRQNLEAAREILRSSNADISLQSRLDAASTIVLSRGSNQEERRDTIQRLEQIANQQGANPAIRDTLNNLRSIEALRTITGVSQAQAASSLAGLAGGSAVRAQMVASATEALQASIRTLETGGAQGRAAIDAMGGAPVVDGLRRQLQSSNPQVRQSAEDQLIQRAERAYTQQANQARIDLHTSDLHSSSSHERLSAASLALRSEVALGNTAARDVADWAQAARSLIAISTIRPADVGGQAALQQELAALSIAAQPERQGQQPNPYARAALTSLLLPAGNQEALAEFNALQAQTGVRRTIDPPELSHLSAEERNVLRLMAAQQVHAVVQRSSGVVSQAEAFALASALDDAQRNANRELSSQLRQTLTVNLNGRAREFTSAALSRVGLSNARASLSHDQNASPAQRLENATTLFSNRSATREDRQRALTRMEESAASDPDAARALQEFRALNLGIDLTTTNPRQAAQLIDNLSRLAFDEQAPNQAAIDLLQRLGAANRQDAAQLVGRLQSSEIMSQALSEIQAKTRAFVQERLNTIRAEQASAGLRGDASPEQMEGIELRLRAEGAAGNNTALDTANYLAAQGSLRELQAINGSDQNAPERAQRILENLAAQSAGGNTYAHSILNFLVAGADQRAVSALAEVQNTGAAERRIEAPNLSNLSPALRAQIQRVSAQILMEEVSRGNHGFSRADSIALASALAQANASGNTTLSGILNQTLTHALNGPGREFAAEAVARARIEQAKLSWSNPNDTRSVEQRLDDITAVFSSRLATDADRRAAADQLNRLSQSQSVRGNAQHNRQVNELRRSMLEISSGLAGASAAAARVRLDEMRVKVMMRGLSDQSSPQELARAETEFRAEGGLGNETARDRADWAGAARNLATLRQLNNAQQRGENDAAIASTAIENLVAQSAAGNPYAHAALNAVVLAGDATNRAAELNRLQNPEGAATRVNVPSLDNLSREVAQHLQRRAAEQLSDEAIQNYGQISQADAVALTSLLSRERTAGNRAAQVEATRAVHAALTGVDQASAELAQKVLSNAEVRRNVLSGLNSTAPAERRIAIDIMRSDAINLSRDLELISNHLGPEAARALMERSDFKDTVRQQLINLQINRLARTDAQQLTGGDRERAVDTLVTIGGSQAIEQNAERLGLRCSAGQFNTLRINDLRNGNLYGLTAPDHQGTRRFEFVSRQDTSYAQNNYADNGRFIGRVENQVNGSQRYRVDIDTDGNTTHIRRWDGRPLVEVQYRDGFPIHVTDNRGSDIAAKDSLHWRSSFGERVRGDLRFDVVGGYSIGEGGIGRGGDDSITHFDARTNTTTQTLTNGATITRNVTGQIINTVETGQQVLRSRYTYDANNELVAYHRGNEQWRRIRGTQQNQGEVWENVATGETFVGRRWVGNDGSFREQPINGVEVSRNLDRSRFHRDAHGNITDVYRPGSSLPHSRYEYERNAETGRFELVSTDNGDGKWVLERGWFTNTWRRQGSGENRQDTGTPQGPGETWQGIRRVDPTTGTYIQRQTHEYRSTGQSARQPSPGTGDLTINTDGSQIRCLSNGHIAELIANNGESIRPIYENGRLQQIEFPDGVARRLADSTWVLRRGGTEIPLRDIQINDHTGAITEFLSRPNEAGADRRVTTLDGRVCEQTTDGRTTTERTGNAAFIATLWQGREITGCQERNSNDSLVTVDRNGEIIKVDVAGHTRQFQRNEHGQVTHVDDGYGNIYTSANGRDFTNQRTGERITANLVITRDGTFAFVRDDNSKIISTTNGFVFGFDSNGNLISTADPNDNGATYRTAEGTRWQKYDRNGNPTSEVWNGTRSVNNEGALTETNFDTGASTVRHANRNITTHDTSTGRLLQERKHDGTVTKFRYDSSGNYTGAEIRSESGTVVINAQNLVVRTVNANGTRDFEYRLTDDGRWIMTRRLYTGTNGVVKEDWRSNDSLLWHRNDQNGNRIEERGSFRVTHEGMLERRNGNELTLSSTDGRVTVTNTDTGRSETIENGRRVIRENGTERHLDERNRVVKTIDAQRRVREYSYADSGYFATHPNRIVDIDGTVWTVPNPANPTQWQRQGGGFWHGTVTVRQDGSYHEICLDDNRQQDTRLDGTGWNRVDTPLVATATTINEMLHSWTLRTHDERISAIRDQLSRLNEAEILALQHIYIRIHSIKACRMNSTISETGNLSEKDCATFLSAGTVQMVELTQIQHASFTWPSLEQEKRENSLKEVTTHWDKLNEL